MSIIHNHAEVSRAMQALQPAKAVRSNGRYQCHECYCYLGQLSVGAVMGCPNCSAINRVED
jgi:protein-arginine kinase activator protein McsA